MVTLVVGVALDDVDVEALLVDSDLIDEVFEDVGWVVVATFLCVEVLVVCCEVCRAVARSVAGRCAFAVVVGFVPTSPPRVGCSVTVSYSRVCRSDIVDTTGCDNFIVE